MKYIIDENGFFYGVGGPNTIVPDGMIYTQTEPNPTLIKPKWVNEQWIEDATADEILTSITPTEVSLWKIRFILSQMQLEESVNNVINLLPEPQKTAATYIWQYGTAVDRYSNTVLFIQSSLELSDNDVNNIFIQANGLII